VRYTLGLSGLLLASTPLASTSWAQTTPEQPAAPAVRSTHHGTAAHSPSGPGPAASTENITVQTRRTTITAAGGLLQRHTDARAIQSVTSDYIAKQAPTQNVVQLLAQQPSVNATPADPFGLDGDNIMVRGLTISDIGFVLDGAPALAPAAGIANAQLIDTENLEEVALTPGSSDTADPVTQAAAGVIYLHMRDPALKAGGQADFSYGSFDTFRGFIRGDTGEIGNSGIRAFLSFSDASAANWRGPGSNKRQQSDFKVMKLFADGSSFSFEGEWNRNVRNNYLYPTAQQWAQEKWVNTDATYGGPNDVNYYKLQSFPVVNNITILAPLHLVLSQNLALDDTPYMLYVDPYQNGATVLTQGNTFMGTQPVNVNLAQNLPGVTYAPGTQVLVNSGSRGITVIGGNNLKLSWTQHNNTVYAGYWYENYFLPDTDPVAPVNQQTGEPYSILQENNYYRLSNGQPYYAAHYNLSYQLNALYLGDNLSLLGGRLKLNAGFKDVMLERDVANYIPGAIPHLGSNENIPLPTLGASYNFDRKNQVYVTGEGDYRQPFLGFANGAFSIATGKPTVGSGIPKSEYAIKEEIGYRYNGDVIVGSVSFFNLNLTNRLLDLNTIQNGEQVTEDIDAGGQTSRGVDAQVGTAPLWGCFTPYLTFEYLDAHQDNNIAVTTTSGAADYLPTAGKTQIQSPRFQAGIGLTYDDRRFFGSLNVKYVSSQYATLINDEEMPGFVTDNITLGYRLPPIRFLHEPTVQVNLVNLNSSWQRNGVYGFTTNATSQRGIYGGTVAGSSPTYYVEPGFGALLTISTGF